jgi:hypothetical protein
MKSLCFTWMVILPLYVFFGCKGLKGTGPISVAGACTQEKPLAARWARCSCAELALSGTGDGWIWIGLRKRVLVFHTLLGLSRGNPVRILLLSPRLELNIYMAASEVDRKFNIFVLYYEILAPRGISHQRLRGQFIVLPCLLILCARNLLTF